jgi:hypothetical protein
MEAEVAAASRTSGRQTTANEELEAPITTADIAANLNAILASTEDGRGLTVLPGSISFLGIEQHGAVKRLGTFTFQISLEDGADTVQREITVLAQK